jgi:hypothetical protein
LPLPRNSVVTISIRTCANKRTDSPYKSIEKDLN